MSDGFKVKGQFSLANDASPKYKKARLKRYTQSSKRAFVCANPNGIKPLDWIPPNLTLLQKRDRCRLRLAGQHSATAFLGRWFAVRKCASLTEFIVP